MIQLRTLRPNTAANAKTKYQDNPFEPDMHAGSHAELFQNLNSYLAQMPDGERFNVFYTLGATNGTRRREWFGQAVIPFDVDDVVDAAGMSDNEALIEVIFTVLKADPDKCLVVHSGNGLQILVQTLHSIPEKGEEFFRLNLAKYTALAAEINAALLAAKLKGFVDVSSFAPNRLFRLPGTENRKPDKQPRLARLLRGVLLPQEFCIAPPPPGVKPAKEPWELEGKEQISARQLMATKIDTPSVEAGCEFLKACKKEPGSMQEPEWYAMLGIVGRLAGGEQKAQEYSRGHPGYSEAGTAKKLAQALASAGPRKCTSINSLWGNCHSCVNFGAVASPILLASKDFIATESSGFHRIDERNQMSPATEDLRKYYSREKKYLSHAKSGSTYVYDEKKYGLVSATEIKGFAHEHFDPKPDRSQAVDDFQRLVSISNLIAGDWFNSSTKGLINFNNGVYRTSDASLEPHSPAFGFLYCLPFDFDPDARSPVFDRFMKDITLDDIELETLLLEFIGYAICDQDYEHHKALILIGEGSNGKSSFIQIVESLLGEKNVSSLSFEDLQSETARADLQGKLLNTCQELSQKDIQNTEHFKTLFGGKTRSRRLYKDAQEFSNLCKFMFAGNSLPVARDASRGYTRRLMPCPFDADFETGGGGDPKIVEKMRGELSGIFNRVMELHARMVERGDFTPCARSKAMLDAHKQEIDPVSLWVAETLTCSPLDEAEGFMTVAELFTIHSAQLVRDNERPMTKINFTKRLMRHIPDWLKRHRRRVVGNEKPWVVMGVALATLPPTHAEF